MNLQIHPDYLFLKEFILQLPTTFQQQGEVLYKVRNEVRMIETQGVKLVVKRFKVPHLVNQIAYSFFRKSKAHRSYEYSLMLIDKGFGAAQPVAYSEYFESGLIADTYYISVYSPYPRNFNEFRGTPMNGREAILRDFARFTAELHEAGIRHLDYGGGNVMFDAIEGETTFCLIDVNRMAKGAVGLKDGCENFKLLYMIEETFHFLIKEYAAVRGFDPEACIREIEPYIQR